MSDDTLIGQLIANRFRVDALVGEGQMARVYVAEQLSLGRRVALKLLRDELVGDASAVARFRREAQAVTRLQSPHTVEFYDFGATEQGSLFIAMELLAGEALRERLDRDGAIPPAEVNAIVRQVAASLDEAHAAGVIHRDLKPENIHFARQPTPIEPFIKVLDFGLAKLVDGDDLHITGKRMTVGTPAYLAPEMAVQGRVADWRADLYALGVIAYEMLSGVRPFSAGNPVAIMVAHAREPIPSIYDHGVDLPRPADGGPGERATAGNRARGQGRRHLQPGPQAFRHRFHVADSMGRA